MSSPTGIQIRDFAKLTAEQRDALILLRKERHDEDHMWSSCLSTRATDSRLLKYICIHVIIIGVIIFAALMLAHSRSCENSNAYLGLLTFSVGLAVPLTK